MDKNLHFKNKKSAFLYLKKESPKYNNLKEAVKSDNKIRYLYDLSLKKLISKKKIYSYFGGKKRQVSDSGDSLSGRFKNQENAFQYLEKNATKYKSMSKARRNDRNMQAIASLVQQGKLPREKIYSYFGGKKSCHGTNRLCLHFKSIIEIETYLQKNHKKYSSLRHASDCDIKMQAIKRLVRYKKIPSSLVLKYFGFNRRSLLREKKQSEILQKLIKKDSNVIKIDKEVYLSKKSRVDFVITLKNNKIILIEVKDDYCYWKKTHISNQISRYKIEGKKKYGKNYQDTILCSPKGKYGMSFEEVINSLTT